MRVTMSNIFVSRIECVEKSVSHLSHFYQCRTVCFALLILVIDLSRQLVKQVMEPHDICPRMEFSPFVASVFFHHPAI